MPFFAFYRRRCWQKARTLIALNTILRRDLSVHSPLFSIHVSVYPAYSCIDNDRNMIATFAYRRMGITYLPAVVRPTKQSVRRVTVIIIICSSLFTIMTILMLSLMSFKCRSTWIFTNDVLFIDDAGKNDQVA